MSGCVNKCVLIGHLGRDPEVRTLNSGDKVVNMRLATSETWRDKQTGDRREKTEWHNIVVFNEGLVKVCEQWLKKGSKLYVEGQMQTRKWTDQAGVEKYSTEVVLQRFRGEIVMLSDNRDRGDSGGQSTSYDDYNHDPDDPPRRPAASPGTGRRMDDDEIPF